jgi:hypothetical protein
MTLGATVVASGMNRCWSWFLVRGWRGETVHSRFTTLSATCNLVELALVLLLSSLCLVAPWSDVVRDFAVAFDGVVEAFEPPDRLADDVFENARFALTNKLPNLSQIGTLCNLRGVVWAKHGGGVTETFSKGVNDHRMRQYFVVIWPKTTNVIEVLEFARESLAVLSESCSEQLLMSSRIIEKETNLFEMLLLDRGLLRRRVSGHQLWLRR